MVIFLNRINICSRNIYSIPIGVNINTDDIYRINEVGMHQPSIIGFYCRNRKIWALRFNRLDITHQLSYIYIPPFKRLISDYKNICSTCRTHIN